MDGDGFITVTLHTFNNIMRHTYMYYISRQKAFIGFLD